MVSIPEGNNGLSLEEGLTNMGYRRMDCERSIYCQLVWAASKNGTIKKRENDSSLVIFGLLREILGIRVFILLFM